MAGKSQKLVNALKDTFGKVKDSMRTGSKRLLPPGVVARLRTKFATHIANSSKVKLAWEAFNGAATIASLLLLVEALAEDGVSVSADEVALDAMDPIQAGVMCIDTLADAWGVSPSDIRPLVTAMRFLEENGRDDEYWEQIRTQYVIAGTLGRWGTP